MKDDEFAFFNTQLAAMLRDGLPLEGALRRLCQEMRAGSLRIELQALEADLAKGIPIAEALPPRLLPELYKSMILIGVRSGDLPGALTMLADYFQRQNNLWTRLKGLMVYPIIVLGAAFLLACFLSYILATFLWGNFTFLDGYSTVPGVWAGLWLSPLFLGLTLLAGLLGVSVPKIRQALRWRLPTFKEASLAQVASAMWLMLKNGVPLNEALGFVAKLEAGTIAVKDLNSWRERLVSGHGKFTEMARYSRAFPPLFIWTVAQAGEDMTTGFQRAAELYQARAVYRSELLLYSLLPCSVLGLAAMILIQIIPVAGTFASFLSNL